jgi:hypothetical protein
VKKTEYMLISRLQNAGQNHEVKISNRSFVNEAQFRYLETRVTNQNLSQEERTRRLNSGNACYHLAQKHFPSPLLSKIIKIKIHRTKILPVICMSVKLCLGH